MLLQQFLQSYQVGDDLLFFALICGSLCIVSLVAIHLSAE